MPKIAATLLFAALVPMFSGNASAQEDAEALIARLDRQRCAVEAGQVTDDPLALMHELFMPPDEAQILQYELEDEFWVGQSGLRLMERFLIFKSQGDRYRLVDCVPFRPYGSVTEIVDGRDAEIVTFGIYDETPRGYDRFTAVYLLDGEQRVLHSVEQISPLLYASGITEWIEPVENPWEWAEARFGIDLGGTRDSIWGFEIDLNADGRPELGITSTASHGTGGGAYAFFSRVDTAYRFIGYLELRTLQVLPTADDGSVRVRTFWRQNIDCGSASLWSNDGVRFTLIETTNSCVDLESYDNIAGAGAVIRPELHQFRPAEWVQSD